MHFYLWISDAISQNSGSWCHMMRWEIPLLVKLVNLQGKARDLEPERPHAAEGQVKRSNNNNNNICLYNFNKSSICEPVLCVSEGRSRAWLPDIWVPRFGTARWGISVPRREGAAHGVDWEGGRVTNTPSPPMAALPWDQLAALGGNASLLPALLASCTSCSGTTSLQSMLEEEGSPLVKAFFLYKQRM